MMNRKLGSLNLLEGGLFIFAILVIFTLIAAAIEMTKERRSSKAPDIPTNGYPSGGRDGGNHYSDPTNGGSYTDPVGSGDGYGDPTAQMGY